MAQINLRAKIFLDSSPFPVFVILHRIDEKGLNVWEDQTGPCLIEWGNVESIHLIREEEEEKEEQE